MEEAEEGFYIKKSRRINAKKIDFEEAIQKKHLNTIEKKTHDTMEKHKDLFTGKVGHYANSNFKLRFKEGTSKKHQ